MMNVVEMDVQQKVEEILTTHIGHMKKEPAFPQECVLSSHLLSGYLKDKVRLVYGRYGHLELFHSWLETDEYLIDVTLFQFLTPKEKVGFYKKQTPEQMLTYIQEKQGSVFIEKTHPLYGMYQPLFYPVCELDMDENVSSYEEFLHMAKGKTHYKQMNWSKSKDVNGVEFLTSLTESNKRITKRHFTKWAVVDNKTN